MYRGATSHHTGLPVYLCDNRQCMEDYVLLIGLERKRYFAAVFLVANTLLRLTEEFTFNRDSTELQRFLWGFFC